MLKNFIKLWTPVLLWACLIFYLSSIPDLSSGLEKFWDTLLRKFAHLFEYVILFMLLARAMKPRATGLRPGHSGVGIIWPIIISILYAFSDEFHQGFVQGRCPGLADIFFDTAGVLLGYLFYIYLIDRKTYYDKIKAS